MESKRKKAGLFFLTGLFAAIAVGLVSASLATNFWIESKPIREVPQNIIDSAKNVSGVYDQNKFKGEVHLGMFYGVKVLNYGFGEQGRETEIFVPKEVQNGLFNFGLWVATIIFAAFSIAWGLVSIGFVLLNIATKPIETVTGPMGLYLWNAFALVFTLLSVIMYVILYHVDLKVNVMTEMERRNYWTSNDKTSLSYSFWFMVVSNGCYFLNIIIIFISGTKIKAIRYQSSMKQANMDGVMMY